MTFTTGDPEGAYPSTSVRNSEAAARWVVVEFPGPGPFQTFYVAQVDAAGNHVHTHPIPFPYEREAERAAARLNVRDFPT